MNDDARPDRTGLNALLRKAEDGAEFAMRKLGRVPPTFLAATPSGLLTFIPSTMADERATDNLATTARLICAGYAATAAVLLFEFGFGEYVGPQGDSFAGRFAELIPPRSATAEQRALARQLLDAMGPRGPLRAQEKLT